MVNGEENNVNTLILIEGVNLINESFDFNQSCQPCSGCPMRPCPPERSSPARFICPPSSPRNICIVPPIPQKPSWKPCCIRIYGIPCNRHCRPRKFIRFNDFDCISQW
ncbi:hypothetical protein M0802_004150 [Mischocyttarus mexicanus]|nr:hypothetical protein M0802_004150 [Mischocyttarus mexicanus]